MDEGDALEMLGLHRPYGGEPTMHVSARLADSDGILAEVAASLPLARSQGRLVRVERNAAGGPGKATTQFVCILFGPLVQSAGAQIGFGSFQVGPILTPHQTESVLPEVAVFQWRPEPSVPITAGLLRLFSVEQIVSEAVRQLRASEHWRRYAEGLGKAVSMSSRELKAYNRLRLGRAPRTRPSEREIELIARRYLELVNLYHVRNPRPQMAAELGLSQEQVRDRIHRARVLGYLLPARRGRVSGEPGPKFTQGGN